MSMHRRFLRSCPRLMLAVYALAALLTAILLLRQLHPRLFDTRHESEEDEMLLFQRALQTPVRNFYCRKRAPHPKRRERYESLFDSLRNATDTHTDDAEHWDERMVNQRFLIAINLHNNEALITDFLVQLLDVIRFLGRRNVFVSVYESGSTDATQTYLKFLQLFLKTTQVSFEIRTGALRRSGDQHRIEFLAAVRNQALQPIWDDVTLLETKHGSEAAMDATLHRFQKVIFLNDIYFCADDIKELVWQSYQQSADMTCAVDFDRSIEAPSPFYHLGFYDTWVARDVNGMPFTKTPLAGFVHDPVGKERLAASLPFQVSCCWNGATVLNARAFYPPHNVRFRLAETKEATRAQVETLRNIAPPPAPIPNDIIANSSLLALPTDYDLPLYQSCSASEISTLCKDFYLAGFERLVTVPRVRVTYDWDTYKMLRTEFEVREDSHGTMETFDPREDEKLTFQPAPNYAWCKPMESSNVRDPDGQAGMEIYATHKILK